MTRTDDSRNQNADLAGHFAKTGRPVLSFENVSKVYSAGSGWRTVLKSVWLSVESRQAVSIRGRSGSGKSTLLHLAAGVDTPTRGSVRVDGLDLAALDDRSRTLLRREKIGMVFQFFHLLSHLSVWENLMLPNLIAGRRGREARDRADHLLERVGLADRKSDGVQRLSGGEMQRLAICRALLRQPLLLLADEPTGNLDDESGDLVMALMLQLVKEQESTLIYVTHSHTLASLADQAWVLHSGILEAQ